MSACVLELAGDKVEDWFRQPPAWEATHSDLQAKMAEKPQRPPAHPVVKEPPQRAAQRPTIGVATIHKHPPKQRGRGMGAPDVIPYTQWQQAAARPSPVSALAYSKAGMPSKNCIVPAFVDEQSHKEVQFCTQCRLPIGELGYDVDIGDGAFVHGECAAQLMQQRAREDEKLRQKKDATLKKKRRAENDIGWKIEHIPLNSVLAGKLGCQPVSNNMVCLVQAEGRLSVRPAPADPAACVNLEYLSLALQVRRREGREPLFSLDPKDTAVATADNPKALWQVKRFEPEWLAGTSIGEVMFQADVYLKELSMGEHAQPVAGMKSCLDYSQDEDGAIMEWNAREWFVVKRAEIQVTQGGALVPCVEMGVEAREMVATEDGLEDAWITWSDHPCVKYADAFTHYFDVIAERKSVIYYLRELAKASALAKHLVDADVCLEESWFNIEGQVNTACSLEIPQLWHERLCSQIQVKNGKIVGAESRPDARIHGVYGGIEFGLERAQVTGAPVARAAVAPPGAIAQVGVPTRQVGPKLTIAQGKITKQAGLLAIPQDTISYATHAGQPAARLDPRGVDLNLNQFDLSAATQMASEPPAGKTGAAGNAFWATMRGECDLVFDEKDAELFKKLFNSSSDRRDEGDLFVPPDTHPHYMQKLAVLLEEEERVRRERSDHFFSEAFAASDPGPLFPSSWMPTVGVQGGMGTQRRGEMHVRPDYYARIEQMLKSASLTPTFDKSTEDGARFRIYKVGTLEARTIQEQDGNEVIGVVFARCAPTKTEARAEETAGTVEGHEQVVSVSEYVEWTHDGARSAAQHGGRCSPQFQRYYILLETEKHNFVATERLADGTVTWAVNPSDQEARNFLARVVRSAMCSNIAVQDFQRYHAEQAQDTHVSAPSIECKRYAGGVYSLALPARADHGRP